jgi:hypothetical protein
LTTRMTPKIKVSPKENRTYTAPICRAVMSNCSAVSKMSLL